jgi:formaldehyde-activating enzyme involved in methanogenesis
MVPRSYIPEIQEATDILIDRNTANYPGCGQIGITIGFSPTPQNDVAVWDTEDYNLISLNQYICTCSNSDRSYIFEAQNEQKAITQMLQNFPDAQNVVANLNTGRKITPRKRQLR